MIRLNLVEKLVILKLTIAAQCRPIAEEGEAYK